MGALRLQFGNVCGKVDGLSMRERTLLVLVIVMVILGLWNSLIYQPIQLEQQKLTDQLNQVEMEISSQSQLAEQIRTKGSFDPNKTTRDQFTRVQSQLSRIKTEIDSEAVELINPQQMAKALEELLRQHKDMVLINLETLPPTKLFTSGEADLNQQANKALTEAPLVYRHALSIEMEGRYFDTLRYLKALEKLKWRFYWNMVDYQVLDYPLARIKITVYTLSFEEGWLGV